MVQLIPPESLRKRCKSPDAFLFSRSNRSDRKITVVSSNAHLTRFTSSTFPAFRHCRCSHHFDLLLFSSSRERLGPGKTPPGKILYHYEHSIPTGFSVQMVNAPRYLHCKSFLVVSLLGFEGLLNCIKICKLILFGAYVRY